MFSNVNQSIFPTRISQQGTIVKIGCLSLAVDIQATETKLIADISELYEPYPREAQDTFPDFAISLRCPSIWSTYFGREIQAHLNGHTPFEPLPRHHGIPIFEAGINYLLATNIARFLLLHAGTMERDGKGVIFPGVSGSGKSTICAALASRGWRLLSDEFAMVRPDNGELQPHPRPISLKNESIDIVSDLMPEAYMSRRYEGTIKGTIAFLQAPRSAIALADTTVKPGLIVFPRYKTATATHLQSLEPAHVFMHLIDHSINYSILQGTGFETLASLVEGSDLYTLTFSDLDDAISVIEDLHASHRWTARDA